MTARSTPRLPRYKRAASPPPMQLTDRDEKIISCVSEFRFATQEQLQALVFTPTTASSCKRRLTLLYHNGYLDRRLIPLRSAFGSNRAVYCLDRRGAELLSYRHKTGSAVIHWRPADNNRELYFLEHMIAANDVRSAATLAAQRMSLTINWTDERELRSRAMKQLVKDPKKPTTLLAVVPDGYFVLQAGEHLDGFALELDRGTVEERPFKEKVRALGEWKVTGTYRRTFKMDSLRVLFVVAPNKRDKGRLERIKSWTEAEGGENLFWFTDLSEVSPETLFVEPIWNVAGRTGQTALLTGR